MLRPWISLTLTARRQPAEGCKGGCPGGSRVVGVGRGQVGFWRACPTTIHQQQQQQQLTSGGGPRPWTYALSHH